MKRTLKKNHHPRIKCISLSGLKSSLLLVGMAVIMFPIAYSKVSDPTGIIEGSMPSFNTNGPLTVLNANGEKMTDGSLMSGSMPFNSYKPGMEHLLPVLDTDDDLGLQVGFSPETEIEYLVHDINGRAITGDELALTPDDMGLSGFRIKFRASVQAFSTTGVPTHSDSVVLESPEVSIGINIPIVVNVNGETFTASLFPRTIFKGATFQILANGTNTSENNDYTFNVNAEAASWLNIDAAGNVIVNNVPSRNVSATISIGLKANPAVKRLYRLNPKLKFMATTVASDYTTARNSCRSFGGDLAQARHISRVKPARLRTGVYETIPQPLSPVPARNVNIDTLFDEWGIVNTVTYPSATEFVMPLNMGFSFMAPYSDYTTAEYVGVDTHGVSTTFILTKEQELGLTPLPASIGGGLNARPLVGLSSNFADSKDQFVLRDEATRLGICTIPLQ